jgi:hypothetical protein
MFTEHLKNPQGGGERRASPSKEVGSGPSTSTGVQKQRRIPEDSSDMDVDDAEAGTSEQRNTGTEKTQERTTKTAQPKGKGKEVEKGKGKGKEMGKGKGKEADKGKGKEKEADKGKGKETDNGRKRKRVRSAQFILDSGSEEV